MPLSAFATWVLALIVVSLLVCLVLLIVGMIFKSKGLMLTGGIPLGLLAAAFFALIGWGAHLQRQSKNPFAVFEKEFGFPPPPEVKDLEGYATNIVVLYENIPPGSGGGIRNKANPLVSLAGMVGSAKNRARGDLCN